MRKVTNLWLILVAVSGVIVGYFIGSSFHQVSSDEILNYTNVEDNKHTIMLDSAPASAPSPHISSSSQWFDTHHTERIYAASNPRGAESLPPGIVEPYSDFYLHRLQGNHSEDLVGKQKYLLALAVGYNQKDNINKIIMKFSENFSIVLFHYDGKTSGWDQFEWSHRAIHISARKQAKWWYAKRFLHPDIVSAYEYIFIWDEDLGVEHFNAEEYLKLVKKHNLEISQPGIESKKRMTWSMTKRRDGVEVHKKAAEFKCHFKHGPPCAGFVEIMAPVFSRKSWQCVWHMIQNDLIHGWGLDFAFWRCVEKPNEKIGVVDAQWVKHEHMPTLGDQGSSSDGRPAWEGVRARCKAEMKEFERRVQRGAWKWPW